MNKLDHIDFSQFGKTSNYGGHSTEWFDVCASYEELIELDGVTIEFSVQEGSYQGDQYCVVRHPERGWGFVCFGYGSCSGCDALQGCCSVEQIKELAEDIHNDIEWYETKEKLVEWFQNRDWAGTYHYYGESGLRDCAEYLGVTLPPKREL